MADEDYVKIPRAMYEQLEAQASRAGTYQLSLGMLAGVLHKYEITAVVTSPPSGSEAGTILTAVRQLVEFAKAQTS